MDISIIICTHNRAGHLQNCARALFAQATAAARCELVIVANACADDTVAVVRAWPVVPRLPVRLVEEPTPGLSVARNAGAAAATGHTVIFLDDDAVPTPQWLAAYAAYFAAHPEVGAGGGPIEPDWGGTPRPAYWRPEFDVNLGRLELAPGTEFFPVASHVWPFGGNMFIQADALRKAGQFRVDLGMKGGRVGWGEETDWFQRHAAAGGLIGYVAGARITHWVNPKNLTRRSLFRRAYLAGVANARLHDGPDDAKGWGAWGRHLMGAVRRGQLGMADQLYLVHWFGKLRGQQR